MLASLLVPDEARRTFMRVCSLKPPHLLTLEEVIAFSVENGYEV